MEYLLKVARLYYEENLNQQQIAKRLNISRVKVYRVLMKAREEGIVNIQLQAPKQDYSELEIRIENYYNIRECIIVPSIGSMDSIYSNLAISLSDVFNRELKDGMSLGFGWGNTIRGVVEKIELLKKYDIKILPTIGGLGATDEQIHANSIAALGVKKIGGKGFVLNCPAILDSIDSKQVFLHESSVKTVLKEWSSLDIAVLPVGYMDYDITIRKSNHISDSDIDYFKSLKVVGDINSNFLDINGNPVNNQIQDRVINLSLDMLKKIKHKIVICCGEKKIIATQAALRSGAVDTLLIGNCIAEKIIPPN